MFRDDFNGEPVWCFKDDELRYILNRELYEELMESGDIDRPNMYNFGYFRMHISHNFSDKAKQILKQRFLEN